MCGRLVHTLTADDYATYVDVTVPAVAPNWDVRPTDTLPILRLGAEGLQGCLARWGFPSACGKKVLFNARSETAAVLPSFAYAYRQQRALVFASGWYEWKGKERFLIQRKDHKPVVMAALWQGARFTLLTTAAIPELTPYHPRMPLVVLRKDWNAWLQPDGRFEPGVRPFPAGCFVGTVFEIPGNGL